MRRYHITVGAKTTVNGTVRTGWECSTINDLAMAREGDEVDCPICDSTGVILCDGPRLVDLLDDRHAALDGDLCRCKCVGSIFGGAVGGEIGEWTGDIIYEITR
jgi:uncharacterized Zn-binding protein involved in type VI secretion